MDLKSAMLGGLRSTADAFQNDIDRISEGRLPDQAIKALQQAIGMAGGPGGVYLPKVPSYTSTWSLLSPELRRKFLSSDKAMEAAGMTVPPMPYDIPYLTGLAEPMSRVVLQAPQLGKFGQFLRDTLAK